MRLTTLEIKGFKSFGDKVTIYFDKGVTSIVGPNGSGKSNVVDAMRWVLGEQKTRMLRSEKMENIIFNGTQNRKAANLAEVSLSFENTKNILTTDYSTITITRKLYRTGESEYFLNGIACRLKDITDLFLDTGIGSDSYSIIELKMIDEIINDKNNTIKMLFEEAAGISKYKIRKKQTLQKLEETDIDLNRVNDLLFEIEKNLKSLETQAKKTEKYYKLREQYKELSTQLASYSIISSQKSFENLHEDETKQLDIKLSIETAINTFEAKLQQLKAESLENEKHLTASQKALNDKTNIIRQYENEKQVKNERLKFLKDKEDSLGSQIQKSNKYSEELRESIKHLSDEKEAEQSKLSELETQLKSLKEIVEQVKRDQVNEQVVNNNISEELQKLQNEIFRIEKIKAVQQSQNESLGKESERIANELKEGKKSLEEIEVQFSQISINRENIENSFEELNEKEAKELLEIEQKEQNLKKSSDNLITVNRKIDAKQNEFNLTKSLVDSMEGFPESIKYLKKNVPHLKKAPLLSDILSCKNEYKVSIENFLEPFMNHFIVDSLDQAHQSIKILDEKKQGRAQFFVLDLISGDVAETKADSNNYTPAIKVIDYERKYQNLCRLLLNGVYITEDSNEENSLIKEGVTILLKNGKFQKTNISLGGGSIGLFEGKKIGRSKNLEILEKEIKILSEEKLSIQKLLDQSLSENTALKNNYQVTLKKKKQVLEELNRASSQAASINARKEQLTINYNNHQKRWDDIQSQLNSLSATESNDSSVSFSSDKLNLKKEELQKALVENQQKLNELTLLYNDHSAKFNQQNISFIQQQNKANTILRELSYKKTQLENIEKQSVIDAEELEKIKKQVFEIVENSSDSDDSILSLYEEKESLEKAVGEIEEQYFKSRGKIDEVENEIKNERKKKEQVELIIQNIKEKLTDIKIQLNSLKERLKVEFEIDIETLAEIPEPSENNEVELKEKVEKIKFQLNNYGPINPMAVEAFNEINERYQFILAQKSDLINAKNSLLQTISEIDTTAKEKFMGAYLQIRENFINVFRSLFSAEDKCDLTLSDPSNPLESDINITAQPKGKRPLSINQLSGGEKTLTATALLFGIYLLKPAPFCIFDEVDAPLDDNNIDKFNKIIKKFSADSQFIIITHNKRTMASTDIIYGVTMIESGVTQVVPVDIREVEAA